MPKVIWNSTGQRLFHTGVDRGMLYTFENPGVSWNGLISVTEAPVSATVKSYYMDGRKIQNLPGSDDFAGTIQAYTAPLEFAPCAGRLHMSTGLFVTEQPKQTFGFSYRTLIGNDVVGTGFAYRIHIVYNATAQISNFSHETNDASPSATAYSYSITTTPINVVGYRPSAHYIFDTRTDESDTITAIENILYGTSTSDPRLPTAAELLSPVKNISWWDLTDLDDFPDGAITGDGGIDFDTDDLYVDSSLISTGFMWDLTGGTDFPEDANVGDWGIDTSTGEIFKLTA
jgi:hypothetical protein